MDAIEQVKRLLAEVLGLGQRAELLRPESALLGSVPELDSTAVIQIITALEERFGITIDDDEIDASLFDTVGSLAAFVDSKIIR
jgi:acyl carrier protein